MQSGTEDMEAEQDKSAMGEEVDDPRIDAQHAYKEMCETSSLGLVGVNS